MSKKTKKGPHPHDQKEQKQIAGCPRCRGKEIFTVIVPVPALGIGTVTTSAESPEALAAATFTITRDTSGLAPLEVLPLCSVPLEAEPDKAPDASPVAPVGFSPH
jgi:hypothetical protein